MCYFSERPTQLNIAVKCSLHNHPHYLICSPEIIRPIVGVTPFAILVISPLTFYAAIQIHQICTFSNIFSLTSTRLSHYRHFWTGLQLFTNFPQFWQNCSAILFAGIGVLKGCNGQDKSFNQQVRRQTMHWQMGGVAKRQDSCKISYIGFAKTAVLHFKEV